MNKTCKIHGELSEENILREATAKNTTTGYTLRCKLCRIASNKKKYDKKARTEGRNKNNSWNADDRICKVHGKLSEEDIFIEKSKVNKNGIQIRCRKCKTERRWKQVNFCTIHGNLKEEDIRKDGGCRICHRLSANRKRDENRELYNKKIAEDKIKNPEKWEARWKREYQNRLKNHGRK